ncbi:hypothetical protein N8152_03145 [bacterium]|nr:hypothetical protein [bacterium]
MPPPTQQAPMATGTQTAMPAPRGMGIGRGKGPGGQPQGARPGMPMPRVAGQPQPPTPRQQKSRKILPGMIVGSLVQPAAAPPPAQVNAPPVSVIRAALSDGPISKSQAKRNRKKLRENA